MTETVEDLGGGGGSSVPVRGLIRFDENTPDDYSYGDARFLRRGVVETDIAKFDTSIWPDTFPIKINEESIRPIGSLIEMGHKPIGACSPSGQIVIPNVVDGVYEALVSDANNINFRKSVQKLPRINPQTPVIFSQGYFVQASSSNVIISNDLYDTYSEVSTGLASAVIGMLGNANAIIAWSTTGKARRSIDGGQSWSDVTGLNGSLDLCGAIKGNTWLVTDDTIIYTSTDNGQTWINQGGINPQRYNDFVLSDGAHFYIHIFNAGYPLVYKSTDGVTWDDGQVLKGDMPTSAPIYANYFNGIFIARAGSNQMCWLSKDGITWHEYFRNGDFNVGTSKPVGIAPTPTGAVVVFENNLIDTLKLLQYAGSINSTNINTEYAECDFVRIS